MNRIIFYSGGLASFKVAHYVKENYKEDNILLLFTDTNFEDEDLYRFIKEGSDKLKLPMLILNTGKDPLDLMREDNFLYNSRIAQCSIKLKVKPARNFIKKGILTEKYEMYNEKYFHSTLEKIVKEPILYFGIDYKEAHRTVAIEKNWKPYKVEFPLVNNEVSDKILEHYNIKRPRLYDMGFSHNNCAGRCIKGGQGHWLTLYKQDRDKFNQMSEFEKKMNIQLNNHHNTNKKYAFIKKQGEPYQLKDLEYDNENRPEQIDLFDFGTCGCFVNED